MINANELRIGNLVFEAGEPSMIYQIERGGSSMYRINDIPYNRQTGCTLNGGEDRLLPIPLTPEILEKAGFAISEHSGYWHEKLGSLSQAINGWDLDDNESGSVNSTPIQYLHQLQNLYFALTGEELTISL